jgi:hypothetical protein
VAAHLAASTEVEVREDEEVSLWLPLSAGLKRAEKKARRYGATSFTHITKKHTKVSRKNPKLKVRKKQIYKTVDAGII